MRKYSFARGRMFVAVVLAVFTLLFSLPNAFARPRGGGFGGGRSVGGFRGGGSIGSSRPSGGGWFSRPSAPSRSTFSTGTSTRTGGFRNGSNIGANTPPRTSSKPWFGSTTRPATPYYARPRYGGTTVVYNNWRPAYGGNIYVYDHRPWYTPYYMYHAPIYSPQGIIVRQAGFNWGAFFLTLAVVVIGIWLLVRVFRGSKTTKTTTYYN